jgi:hypothetical protein
MFIKEKARAVVPMGPPLVHIENPSEESLNSTLSPSRVYYYILNLVLLVSSSDPLLVSLVLEPSDLGPLVAALRLLRRSGSAPSPSRGV